MRPKLFNLQLAPRIVFCKREKSHAGVESVWNIRVQLDGNFAVPSLRLEDAGERDELVAYSRISSVKRL